MSTAAAKSTAPTREILERFVIDEAALLDDRRYREWNALFTSDGLYWVPAAPEQDNPYDHVSLMFEDWLLRKVRIERFGEPDAYSLQPMPRAVRVLGSICVLDMDEAKARCTVRSKFVMLIHQREQTRSYGGTIVHTLDWSGGDLRMAMKRVDLVDADGIHDCINDYF